MSPAASTKPFGTVADVAGSDTAAACQVWTTAVAAAGVQTVSAPAASQTTCRWPRRGGDRFFTGPSAYVHQSMVNVDQTRKYFL
jgi:hypothetical protein